MRRSSALSPPSVHSPSTRWRGDAVLLSFRESTGEVGFVSHVYITLDGPIGAGEIFGFKENVLGNFVEIQQVKSVHAHAYAAGELAEQRLNVFVVRLKP